MPDPITPQDQQDQQIAQQQVDTAAIEAKAQERAEAIANEKIEKMKEDLAQSLTGKSTKPAPKSWDEIYDTAEQRATAKAEAMVDAKLAEREKEQKKQQDQTLAQQAEAQKEEWAAISRDWTEAVADGIIPDLNAEVKAKLKAGTKYEDLTDAEQNDPGLKAYNESRMLHIKLKNEGKSSSFYRTVQKFYNKQPAGAGAPVLGGGTPSANQQDDYKYEDIQANRRAKFGF